MKLGIALVGAFLLFGSRSFAEELKCDLRNYKASKGLTAEMENGTLRVEWQGERSERLRAVFGIRDAQPAILELAVQRAKSSWSVLARNLTPEYSIVSGKRRISRQQLQPMQQLKIDTPEMREREKWNAFWDAPLDIPGLPKEGRGFGNNLPPDLPRQATEIRRASANYSPSECQVKTNGARIEIAFPGLQLGVFSGRLQYTLYKGTNLIRQEAIAKTDEPSVAYKYDTGLKGLPVQNGSRLVWRDTGGNWQSYQFGGTRNENELPLKTANRLLIAEQGKIGAIAVFPPPHTFFWAREIETNLGYNWYRKDSDSSFSFGIRQAEREEEDEYQGNFALYSAPPGTWQRMAVYFYASAEPAQPTLERVLAYTHGDRFRPLPGYQVMAHHYHMDIGERLRKSGSLDTRLPDLVAIKAAGINIVSPIRSFFIGRGSRTAGDDPLRVIADSVEGARRHSDKDFLIMPSDEVYNSPLGGHTDLLFAHPVFWDERKAGQPFVEEHPKYGKVYHVAGAEDMMEMARREGVLISMPHPRTKGSTGFPDAIKDKPYFKEATFHGAGFRWGMGLDLSEQRLCDQRCLSLLDDMSNWLAGEPAPLKYLIAITETRYKAPGDEIYASSPVNYVKLDRLPVAGDVSAVIQALQRGDSFVTSGEVLVPYFSIEGTGNQRAIVAEVQWTFPLEFVEVVWGDGQKSDRKIISATHLPPFGRYRFQIPFNAAGQKWVRFAAWDSAGNGAILQPVRLSPQAHAGAGRKGLAAE